MKTHTNTLRRFGLAISVLGLFFFGASFVYGQVMRDRLLPGTKIAGVDVGGLSLQEAAETLKAAVSVYETNAIRFRVGEKSVSAKLSELGFSFSIDATLTKVYERGRASGFVLSPFPSTDNVMLEVVTNEEKEKAYLVSLANRFSQPARDASFAFEDRGVVLRPATIGQSVVPPSIVSVSAQLSTMSPIDINVVVHDVTPDLVDDEVLPLREAFVDAASHPVTVTAFGGSTTLTLDDMEQWLTIHSVDGVPELGLDEGFAETKLAELATLVSVAPKHTFDFSSEEKGEYALKNAEGRELDEVETTRRIISVLDDPSPRTVEVAVRTTPPGVTVESVTAPKTNGKVIAVDLGRQAVFAFEDGLLKFWTRTSTGKGAFKTPTGEWNVYNKTRRQVMSGPGYYLPNVEWVMPYDGDYTLHGAYWHTEFGTPRSHGCSNLSNADAQWIYQWADIGTPVIVTEHLS